ncbi:MAG: DUF3343 domain-containing protein [Firmicutes bacterium]|jgi:biotin synthase|nr:DUF3343 domain-containing protein [Bacillota bacterium]HOB22299.1 DUF3343 domain-containing protein [Bacillota bacterium]HQD39212.1 DUF3343 domain-containing protein [Bacillota bacterium]
MSLWEKFAPKENNKALLICSSTHHLLLAERLLSDHGIQSKVVPVPQGIVTHCTSGIEFASAKEAEVKELLEEHEIAHEGIYRL